jgi:hypothetical protein
MRDILAHFSSPRGYQVRRVREKLQAAGQFDAVVKARLEELQIFGVDQVSDGRAREAVIYFLAEVAPIQFFVAPASRGQHHPKWQNERGGVIRNTVECCLGIDRKMRAFPQLLDGKDCPVAQDRDIIFIATILSDTFKHVDMEGEWKGFSHHRIAAEKWKEVAKIHGLEGAFSEKVFDAIFWHLGRFTPEWDPKWKDPNRDLSLHTFLVHMLDMDFSNKELERIFVPKSPVTGLMGQLRLQNQEPPSSADNNIAFLKQEFDTSHSYFVHIETKLFNLVTFYATLFLAVVSACYYILISTAFSGMRTLSFAIAAMAFFLLGSFTLGMYTELRTRKIKTLEQMAIIREFFAKNDVQGEPDISAYLTLPTGIDKCPPYLRRPSEDWYTVLLMIFVNSVALIFAAFSVAKMLGMNPISVSRTRTTIAALGGVSAFILAFYGQFRRITMSMLELDCDREKRYGKAAGYDLFPKGPVSIPRGLRWLDELAAAIESSKRNEILARIAKKS